MVNAISTQLDDAALLRAYSEQGDRQAMNVLFARHADGAFRVALRCSRNAADAEDAVQTAFIEVLRHAAQYRGESAVRAWIFGFVVNATRHKAREEGRRAVREEKASVSGEVAPEDRALQEAVRHAVQELPEHYRLPVWLHYCEGLSSPEVADALSLSENTVRSQLSRGVEELRTALSTSGLAVTSVALLGSLALVATESAPATLTASLPALASTAVPGAAKAGILAKVAAGTIAAAAVLSTAVALWWGNVPEEPRPPEFTKIDEKIKAWQPLPEERRFDQIGWAKSIPEALRLAKEHNRPLFVMAHVGHINTGRSDGGSMSFRAGPLADPKIIEFINTRYVPAYINSESKDPDHERIYRTAIKAGLKVGTERVYILKPDGSVVEALHSCHITLASLTEALEKYALDAGPTLVPPSSQSLPPAGERSLHVIARYLDKDEKPFWPVKTYSYHAFPAEEWIPLTVADEAALVPDPKAQPGAAWYVDMAVAARLLSHLYPLTGNYGSADGNRLEDVALSAKVIAGRGRTAWIRLDGRVRLTHSFFSTKDDRSVEATVTGYVEYDRKEKAVRAFRLVTDQALYGKEKFGVAIRSVP